ncbi:MAG: trypsin-like peptidase domain-containing protein [Pyrinomonadaceae bacterium]|nr:trypsin-like peptidase domain-containing protein [Pyrinomonadaceae bacterium]
MAPGIIIHVTVGLEKRTEFFAQERIRIGSDSTCDIQIHTSSIRDLDVWLELDSSDGTFRVANFAQDLAFQINDKPLRRYVPITDGDIIAAPENSISFGFFSLEAKSALITTNREQPHISQFIEDAAIESYGSAKRDDAKAFLREFTRELAREISWTTKLITLVIAVAFLTGILYIGYAVNRELREAREQAKIQSETIKNLEEKLGQASNQLGELDKSNKDIIKTVSLAPNLRVAYGNSIGLIVGVYDLVDKRTGKVLRYADPSLYRSPYEPQAPENPDSMPSRPQVGVTTDGNGPTVEYDFIGTCFYVGQGYIVTNRHVVRPWEEDDGVKQMMAAGNARARVKKLVIYFPDHPQPFPLTVKSVGGREDLAIGFIDPATVPDDLPTVPLDTDTASVEIGKTVVTMGYPNGPDRLLAMVDDAEARSINQRFGNSRQDLINFLAQSQKIVPLTTQGSITDLDSKRIVHDARTAEGGSGAPLFGQSGEVIGVNFGVFTENTAANMAVPVRFAITLLESAGWVSPDSAKEPNANSATAAANVSNPTAAKTN